MKKVIVSAAHDDNNSLANIAHALIIAGLYDFHVGLTTITLNIQEENAEALKEVISNRLDGVSYRGIRIGS